MGLDGKRFLHSVNQVMPKRGDTLELPLDFPEPARKQCRFASPLLSGGLAIRRGLSAQLSLRLSHQLLRGQFNNSA